MADVASVAKRNAQSELAMNSEQPSRSRIAVPIGVRWREFRIQMLPLLAFAGSLGLAGVLWLKAVVPVSMEPLPDPPSVSEQVLTPVQALGEPVIHQASRGATNAIGKTPSAGE
jgi:hypothetical protein